MPERYQSYDREAVKAGFKREFGDMLERTELQGMLGKQNNVGELMAEGKLIVLWPGRNQPAFPYFQLNKGKLRPEIELILSTIEASSEGKLYSPRQLCKWFFTPINGGKRVTPLDLMKKGKTPKLLEEASKFGRRLLPRKPQT